MVWSNALSENFEMIERHGNTNLYIDMPSKVTLVSQSLKGYVVLERKVLKTIDSSISDQIEV